MARDYAQAAMLFRKVCDGGNAWGCGRLADLYRDGHGVAQSEAQAANYWRRACDGGWGSA